MIGLGGAINPYQYHISIISVLTRLNTQAQVEPREEVPESGLLSDLLPHHGQDHQESRKPERKIRPIKSRSIMWHPSIHNFLSQVTGVISGSSYHIWLQVL